jgi:hypothetical protein
VWVEPDESRVEQVLVTGTAEGTFAVPDIRGRYLLQVGNLLVSTTTRRVVLGDNVAGRVDVYVANPDEGLTLTASNLAPWTTDDELQLASWGAGIAYFSSTQRRGILKANAPDAGDTALTAVQIDLAGENVVEASKGDDLRVLQLSARGLDGGGTWKHATRAATLTVDLALNQSTPVQADLVTLPQAPVAVRYDSSAFEAARADVHPEAVAFESRWLLDAHLGSFGPDTISSGAPDLALLSMPARAGVVDLALTFGNPFPSSWTPFVTLGSAFEVLYRAPLPDGGLAPARSEVATLSRVASFAEAQAGVLDAQLLPVRDVRLDGELVGEGFPLVEFMPQLSWQAPARGTVSRLDVECVELQGTVSITRRAQGLTLRVVGEVTSVRLPPGFLKPGAIQYLRLTAVMQPPSWNPEAPLREVGPPASTATTMTRAFLVRPLP